MGSGASAWLASRTTGFGGRCALELLAQGERAQVVHVLNHLRYGLCA
ncbi:antitoxin Xre/MbcA/ParS toxin-binding domain-containing protein [Paraburkholderia sp. EG287B]